MLFVEVLDFAVVVLVLLAERIYDISLRLYLSGQILVSLLDEEHLLLLGKFGLEQLVFSLLLGLQFFLENSVLVSLLFLFFGECIATTD